MVPIFVAVMILLIRVLIIGTFSLAGDRLFTTVMRDADITIRAPAQQQTYRPVSQPIIRSASSLNQPKRCTKHHIPPCP